MNIKGFPLKCNISSINKVCYFSISYHISKDYTLSNAQENMGAFVQLTDDVVFRILHSQDDNLQESRAIVTKILQRKLYTLVSEAISQRGQVISLVSFNSIKSS